jgi:uncharacterized protein
MSRKQRGEVTVIGLCTIELRVGESQSLKDKRQVIQSLLTRARQKLNVSIAEVGGLQSWQRAVIAGVCVANESAAVDRLMGQVVDFLESDPRVEIVDYSTELL